MWVALGVVALAVIFVVASGVRPAYDAYGWLVWGRQASHLQLDTSAPPSWKPLTFLFTFPYTLLFGRQALWLWMVTAVAAGFAAPVSGARLAFRLSSAGAARGWPAYIAAALGAAAVLGIEGYWHFLMIATADPMMVALTLGAIDAALSGRPRLAWLLLLLLCLGRPEAVVALLACGGWLWWRRPAMRRDVALGLLALAVLWLGMAELTSGNWMVAGEVLGNTTRPLPGNKLLAVMRGFVGLYELPMQLAVLSTLAAALLLRERRWLLLFAAAASWLITDIAMAIHGWGIAPRYMLEPAAVAVVLVCAAAGRALATRPGKLLLRASLLVVVAGWLATMAPQARMRARLVHNGILLGRTWARQIRRLHDAIAQEGGPKRIIACGGAVTTVAFQSILAWELDENVSDVSQDPRASLATGQAIVLFTPVYAGWRISAVHAPASHDPAACRGLALSTATN